MTAARAFIRKWKQHNTANPMIQMIPWDRLQIFSQCQLAICCTLKHTTLHKKPKMYNSQDFTSIHLQ